MRTRLPEFPLAAARLFITITAALVVPACDGIHWTGPRVADQSPSGIFSGSFTSTDVQPAPNRQVVGMVSEDFDAHFLLGYEHYAGMVAVDGDALSGSLIEYRGRQGLFLGFDGLSTISLDGEVTARDGMFGTYAGDDAEGRFALTYRAAYGDGSSLERLSGMWSYSEASSGGAVYTITLEIDGNGQMFATDTAGCVFSGQMTLIDDRYSVYRAGISVTDCGAVNGEYGGLAFIEDTGNADFLYVGTDSGQFACAFQVRRL